MRPASVPLSGRWTRVLSTVHRRTFAASRPYSTHDCWSPVDRSCHLGAWGTARLAVANPTARLPFWGSPPHKPSGTRFLNLVMISSLIFGTAQLFDGGNHPSQLWEIPVFLTFLAASLVPSA